MFLPKHICSVYTYIYIYIHGNHRNTYIYIYTCIYICMGYAWCMISIRGMAPSLLSFRSGCITVAQRSWWNSCCAPKLSVLAATHGGKSDSLKIPFGHRTWLAAKSPNSIWRFLARNITDFYGPFFSKPCLITGGYMVWWHNSDL